MSMDRRTFFRTSALAAAGGLASVRTAGAAPHASVLKGEPAACAAPTARSNQAVDAAIWRSYFDVRRVWGYANRHSVDTGESFKIILTTGPGLDKVEGQVVISRIGVHDEGERKEVWRSEKLVVERLDVQATSAALGADWAPAIDWVPTDGWATGYYAIDFALSDNDIDYEVAYIIVTNPNRSGDVLVELGTNTYNAYNAWGGYSLYESAFAGERAQILSFDRPASPAFYDYDYYLVMWLEALARKRGFTIDYASNFDVHRDRSFTDKPKLYISGTHNEYWSKEQFDAVHHRIFKLGKPAIFFGANTAYWQVRYADMAKFKEDWGRQLVCYKSPDDPMRQRGEDGDTELQLTMLFRDGARMPETMLCGVAYDNFFNPGDEKGPKYPYKVMTLDSPFFDGLDWQIGHPIADVVGYEWDNRDPKGDGARLWDAKLSRIPPIDPATIKVLFAGEPLDEQGPQGSRRIGDVHFASGRNRVQHRQHPLGLGPRQGRLRERRVPKIQRQCRAAHAGPADDRREGGGRRVDERRLAPL